MIDFLKSSIHLSNFFIFLFCLSLWLYVSRKRKLFRVICYSGIAIFLVCSTSYIPKKLVSKLESGYKVLNTEQLDSTEQYIIHVLGAGYSLDDRLPAVSKLQTNSLARLNEGIRIFHKLPKSTLVTSGYSSVNLESQASVARSALIELGIASENIQMLETPSNTLEEVIAFKEKFATDVHVIVVTDATHMPRAIKTYQFAGFKPYAAPANFKVKFGPNIYNGFTLPNIKSIQIMDQWIREELATLKFVLLNTKV